MAARVRIYLEQKAKLEDAKPPRVRCLKCRKPEITCYCAELQPFLSEPQIIILMHPLEFKHPIGTGRLTHNCLSNSQLWVGADFANSSRLNSLLVDQNNSVTLLFPNKSSQDLSLLNHVERRSFLDTKKNNVIIVLDATWHLAKKMLHRTPELQKIPRICFTPVEHSKFIVRRQPHPKCYSTIEAVHEVLVLLNPEDAKKPQHLMDMFQNMLAKQLSFKNHLRPSRHKKGYERRKAKARQIQKV